VVVMGVTLHQPHPQSSYNKPGAVVTDKFASVLLSSEGQASNADSSSSSSSSSVFSSAAVSGVLLALVSLVALVLLFLSYRAYRAPAARANSSETTIEHGVALSNLSAAGGACACVVSPLIRGFPVVLEKPCGDNPQSVKTNAHNRSAAPPLLHCRGPGRGGGH
jgi:hypothetical protein